ncbi:MAG: nickel pincer cofactor biosynthesis protein LarB [Candidatus Micrarchaeia archaeon]
MSEIRRVVRLLKDGSISPEEAERLLRFYSIEKISDIANLDKGRVARVGIPEIVLAEGKKMEEIYRIVKGRKNCIVSRVSEKHVHFLRSKKIRLKYYRRAGIIVVRPSPKREGGGVVGVLAAGTADIGVAEEAAVIAELMGCKVIRAYDVGIAGIHRLFRALKKMSSADCLVVAAGREGALPSIVAGIVDIPVIGLPTSVGYGFGGNGEGALKAMLQSCSFLTVVNIDNGVGAGACASLIARRSACSKN